MLVHHSQKKRRRDMLSFIIGLLAGACFGFMACSILAAGRIRDAELAVELAEWRAKQR